MKFLDKIVAMLKVQSSLINLLNKKTQPVGVRLSGIHPGYSCKEGRIVEDGLLVEFPCTPTRTRSVYSY
jgi:hypothetical protein